MIKELVCLEYVVTRCALVIIGVVVAVFVCLFWLVCVRVFVSRFMGGGRKTVYNKRFVR